MFEGIGSSSLHSDMVLKWKLDRTYDDMWNSFFFSVALCAVLVSLVDFFYLITFLVILLLIFHFCASTPKQIQMPEQPMDYDTIDNTGKSKSSKRVSSLRRKTLPVCVKVFGRLSIPSIVVEEENNTLPKQSLEEDKPFSTKHDVLQRPRFPWDRSRSSSCPDVSKTM